MATYEGEAGGYYALFRRGESDSGMFTAKARLMVDFNDNNATGKIYDIKGADGRIRDGWPSS